MRNRIDDELAHIRKEVRTVRFQLPAHSAYEATLKRRQLSGWSPPHSQVRERRRVVGPGVAASHA